MYFEASAILIYSTMYFESMLYFDFNNEEILIKIRDLTRESIIQTSVFTNLMPLRSLCSCRSVTRF